MNARRRQPPPPRRRGSLAAALKQAMNHHFKDHVAWYVPAVFPFFFFILAHLLTLVAFVLIRYHVVPENQSLYHTMVTWSVYGLLPLLLCSYLCFFVLARPGRAYLARKFPQRPVAGLHVMLGILYGAGVGLALLILLQPGFSPKSLLIFLLGMAVGLGNWLVYRKLMRVDPVTGQPQAIDPVKKGIED